jgi:hypothetical protein
MDSSDAARSAVSPSTRSLDDRGLAQFHELVMARASLRRPVDPVLPTRESPGPGGDERPLRGGLGPRCRPGKRWQPSGSPDGLHSG